MTRLLLAALITLATLQPVTSQTPTDTAWMMVQHDVADLEAWRDVFDSGLSARQSAGELQFEIVTMDGPPATVLAISNGPAKRPLWPLSMILSFETR